MDLRALVGHTSRSLVTVETYLGQPAATEDLTSPAAYLAGVAAVDPASVADRGRAAGKALGDDPAGAVRALVDQPPLVAGNDDLLVTGRWAHAFRRYPLTRTFELVVHGLDIARAAPIADPGLQRRPADDGAAGAGRRGGGPRRPRPDVLLARLVEPVFRWSSAWSSRAERSLRLGRCPRRVRRTRKVAA